MPVYHIIDDDDARHVEATDMLSAIRVWREYHECTGDPDQVTLVGNKPVIREKSAASVEGS